MDLPQIYGVILSEFVGHLSGRGGPSVINTRKNNGGTRDETSAALFQQSETAPYPESETDTGKRAQPQARASLCLFMSPIIQTLFFELNTHFRTNVNM